MDIAEIDPRTATWEVESPVYRVYFWERGVGGSGVPLDRVAFSSNEFEISGAKDVSEVIAWADATAGSVDNARHGEVRTYSLYAVAERHGSQGLIRLAGSDPNSLIVADS